MLLKTGFIGESFEGHKRNGDVEGKGPNGLRARESNAVSLQVAEVKDILGPSIVMEQVRE